MRRTLAVLLAAVSLSLAAATLLPRRATTRTQATADFLHFESGHVHPLAMTPDGSRLLAVNTEDGRLAVFSLTGPAPARIADIPVGLEPVSVAVRQLAASVAAVVGAQSTPVPVRTRRRRAG